MNMHPNDPRRQQQEAHQHDFAVWAEKVGKPLPAPPRAMGPVNVDQRPVALGRQVILDALDDCKEFHIVNVEENADKFARALLKRLNIPVQE
jgi:hypothetical protein